MSHYNKIAGQRLVRIEALCDGVFAIAMTFLVFNLETTFNKLSSSTADLPKVIASIVPNLLSFLLSFITLGIFWTAHSTQFTYIRKSDRNLNWINIFFLMFASLLPFSTNILGTYIYNPLSLWVYWLNIFALGLTLLIHWKYALSKHFAHFKDQQEEAFISHAIHKRIYNAQALYILGALIGTWQIYLGICLTIAVQLNYAFGVMSQNPKPFKRKRKPQI